MESTTGSPQSGFGFVGGQGYQEDSNSGLKLLGHRYYDPSTGRFLTRDHAMDGRNWFGYCANNPLSMTDPLGLFGWGKLFAGAVAGVAIIVVVATLPVDAPVLAVVGLTTIIGATGGIVGGWIDGDKPEAMTEDLVYGAMGGAFGGVGGAAGGGLSSSPLLSWIAKLFGR